MMSFSPETTTPAAYVAPTLTVYGSVAALTAAGSQNTCEHTNKNGTCSFQQGGNRNRRG